MTPRPHPIDCRTAQAESAGGIDHLADPVGAHLETCPACREETRRLQASWALLNVVEDREPSPQFTARVMAKLRPDPLRAGVSRLPSLGSRGFRWAALAAAAAVIVLVVAGVLDREPIKAPSNGSEVVADLELVESEELLQHLDVVQDLDLLLLMDEG